MFWGVEAASRFANMAVPGGCLRGPGPSAEGTHLGKRYARAVPQWVEGPHLRRK